MMMMALIRMAVVAVVAGLLVATAGCGDGDEAGPRPRGTEAVGSAGDGGGGAAPATGGAGADKPATSADGQGGDDGDGDAGVVEQRGAGSDKPPDVDASLAEIRALRDAGQFNEAFLRARRLLYSVDDPQARGRIKPLADEVRRFDRAAPRLRYALEQLGEGGAQARVARQRLEDGGAAARLLLRQAVREAEADLALAAVDLLKRMEAADLPALVDGRLATTDDPAFRTAAFDLLHERIAQLPPAVVARHYQRMQATTGSTQRRHAGLVYRYIDAALDGKAAALSAAVQTPGAGAEVRQFVEAALASDRSDLRQWAKSVTGMVSESFEGYAAGSGIDAMAGWYAGENLAGARIDGEQFYGKSSEATEGRSLRLAARVSEDDWQDVLRRDLDSLPRRGSITFEFKFWETTENTDGNLWLRNARGRNVIGVGTENPEWEVVVDGEELVNDSRRRNDYQDWIRVVLTVDLDNDRARVTFIDKADDDRQTYGWFDIPPTDRLATMGIGPSRWWRVDDIRIHLGPAEEIHASD